ncbi:MAG: asparagine synthetase B family protein, partial [Gemmatimonadaceae bacterium]
MNRHAPVSRVINLIAGESQRLWSVDEADARQWLLEGDTDRVLGIGGSFALVAQDGERVVLA